MVKVSIELVRKKAEHHDGELAPLEEISLHQERIEKIELIQNLCPRLKILLLQSNLIPKIENLHKLKELEYLNLAINNIEKIENLEKCESLQKLDLTLNFIGELTSIENLQSNFNLQILYLTGNPCTDYEGYRDYVIATLPQIEVLDCLEVKRSQRIIAIQNLHIITNRIIEQQEVYAIKRTEQKIRLEKEYQNKWTNNEELIDEEQVKRFWNEKSEHCPEVRIEIERQSELREKSKNKQDIKTDKISRPLFASDGRPYNINECKLKFTLDESNPHYIKLNLFLYKYLDTSLIIIDMQPLYVRVTVKGKIFQLSLTDEINIEKSTAQRSQTTGHLLLTMIKLKSHIESKLNPIISDTCDLLENKPGKKDEKINSIISKREYLEIGSATNVLDFTKIASHNANKKTCNFLLFPKEKIPTSAFIDNPDVPPLI